MKKREETVYYDTIYSEKEKVSEGKSRREVP